MAETAQKSHGLLGSLEAPDWPPLTLPEADRILRRYPQASAAKALLSISPRPFSAASLVATPEGSVFLKRHHLSIRDRAGLLEEHNFINALRQSLPPALSIPAVLLDENGDSAITLGEWTYEVHSPAPGIDLYEEALSWTPFAHPAHARAAGRALAQLHFAAQTYQAPPRKQQQLVSSFTIFASPVQNPESLLQSYLEARPNLRRYAEKRDWHRSLAQLHMPFYDRLSPHLSGLPPLWTHNDFHASNLTWMAETCTSKTAGPESESVSVAAILDFGLTDRTNAIHDLATTIERNIVEWLRIADPDTTPIHLDHLDALLAGYEEIIPLSHEMRLALAAMLPLVHCEFALSETDYFLTILNSEDKAYLAYEGYFLAHTEWFLRPQGQKLLDHLNRGADSPGNIS